MIIRCGDREFNAHRLVLSSHSEFFSKLCSGEWKESETGVVTLEEVDAAVVDVMLYFMYRSDYSVNKPGISDMVFHAQVYAITDRYLVPRLTELSRVKFGMALEMG